MSYSPTNKNFLTVANATTNNGQKNVRIILNLQTNVFYSLDDEGNFAEIGAEDLSTLTDALPYLSDTSLFLVKTAQGNQKLQFGDLLGVIGSELAPPYLEYTARVTQTGTDKPNATVIYNNTGVSPNWTYSTTGKYNLNLSAFAALGTVVLQFESPVDKKIGQELITDYSAIVVRTYSDGAGTTPANGVFNANWMKILVYE